MSDQHEHDPGVLHDGHGDEPADLLLPGEHEPVDPSQPAYVGGARRSRRRGGVKGCLAVLVALAVVAGLVYVGVTKGIEVLRDQFADPEDFAGPGRGKVAFEVANGDTSAQICRNLKEQSVVASVDACIGAATANPNSPGIQAGFYELRKEMPAADAIEILVEPANIQTTVVAVPEGLRVEDIVEILAEGTGFPAQAFEKALDDPAALGLPGYAGGNPEGYLFPATYEFPPKAKPAQMLKQMVDRWREAAEAADLEGAAQRLGYTPHELMTVASLVEAEGRGDDMPKIARVVYNRIENPDNGVTNGLLQVDATVNYALGREPIARLTLEEIESVADSPYNTYKQPGLPPGPIEAPGDAAIAAAAAPADGPWLFYVTVNLETGQTKFTEDYDEFLRFSRELDEYCATQSERC